MMRLFVIFLTVVILAVGGDTFKRYDIESGYVKYKMEMKSSAGNSLNMRMSGTKTIKFKDYGAKEISEEETTFTQNILGKTTTEKSHKMTLMDSGKVYAVDFNSKTVYEMPNMGGALAGVNGRDMQTLGLDMLKKMGGKKIGTDKVLGYECDVWEISGTTKFHIYTYKGVLLKIETNMAGSKTEQVAVEAKFGIDINDNEFKLPDFPKRDVSKMMEQMGNMMDMAQ